MMNKLLLLILIPAILFIFSCKKDSFITSSDARISFSADSLRFDTVFTSTGSITQEIKIINLNDQKLRLSNIKLMGGSTSVFKINIDGAAEAEASDIELEANDSMYVFVSVYIDPNLQDLPFVLQDSIQVSFNGNEKYIQLEAWGQNAHFLKDQKITANTTWPNDKPYVILGSLQVDTDATLSIQKGCRIYVHADAPLLIDGTLQVQGDKYDSTRVYFQGDRLDDPYRNYPGSWPGIYFRTNSKDNILQYAVIRNAYQGAVAEDPSSDANPKLTLDECIIDNIYDAGILGANTSIRARNCLVSNCGKNIVLGYGGNYDFVHCTVAGFSNEYINHQQPVLQISNYVVQGSGYLTNDLSAGFTNCIFWGDNNETVSDEVITSKQGSNAFDVHFDNCLWKIKNDPANVNTSNIIANQDPLFDSTGSQKRYYDFRLGNGSPAIDKGKDAGVTLDLDGNSRPVGLPDLGAYEKR